MEIIDIFVYIFVGAVGFFDFEGVEGFGVDDAFDFAVAIYYWEIGEAGFIELV